MFPISFAPPVHFETEQNGNITLLATPPVSAEPEQQLQPARAKLQHDTLPFFKCRYCDSLKDSAQANPLCCTLPSFADTACFHWRMLTIVDGPLVRSAVVSLTGHKRPLWLLIGRTRIARAPFVVVAPETLTPHTHLTTSHTQSIKQKSGGSWIRCLVGITLVMDGLINMLLNVGPFLGLQIQLSSGGGRHTATANTVEVEPW